VTRYLLDTDIWIYLMRNRPPEVRQRFASLSPASIVLSPIVLGELHVGWRKSQHAEANRRLLQGYTEGATLEPLTVDTAAEYGDIRSGLERAGTPIGANDMWIAAHARANGCVLVTHNVVEFQRVPGLKIEDWVNG
jgi:tRNA(fMet)-specific endonuclease VapC